MKTLALNLFLAYILKAAFVLLGWGALYLGPPILAPFFGGSQKSVPMSRKLPNFHGRVSNGEPKLSQGWSEPDFRLTILGGAHLFSVADYLSMHKLRMNHISKVGSLVSPSSLGPLAFPRSSRSLLPDAIPWGLGVLPLTHPLPQLQLPL